MIRLNNTKYKALTTVFIIIIYFCCYGSSGREDNSNQSQNQPVTFKDKIKKILKMSTGILEEQTDDLQSMLKSGKIRILTTYTYGNYFIHEGKTYGFEYSMMEEFKKYLIKKDFGKRMVVLLFSFVF